MSNCAPCTINLEFQYFTGPAVLVPKVVDTIHQAGSAGLSPLTILDNRVLL